MNMPEIMQKALSMAHTCDARSEKEKAEGKAAAYNASVGNLDPEEYDCKICLNKGMLMKVVERDDFYDLVSVPCKCMRTRATIRNMRRSGLKDIITDYTFAKYIATEEWQKKIKEAAIAYSNNPANRWFFIGGQTGAGKTHLCTAICRKFLLDGKSVKYMLWRDEIVRLKAAVNDADTYQAMMDEIKNVDVLYVDDLFKTGKSDNGIKQRPTSADVNIAFEILNHRYCNPHKLTIVSSECTAEDLMNIDEAIAGRILERSKAYSLNPDIEKNYRLKGAIKI